MNQALTLILAIIVVALMGITVARKYNRMKRIRLASGYEKAVMRAYLEHRPLDKKDLPTIEDAMHHVIHEGCWHCMALFQHYRSQLVALEKGAKNNGDVLGL